MSSARKRLIAATGTDDDEEDEDNEDDVAKNTTASRLSYSADMRGSYNDRDDDSLSTKESSPIKAKGSNFTKGADVIGGGKGKSASTLNAVVPGKGNKDISSSSIVSNDDNMSSNIISSKKRVSLALESDETEDYAASMAATTDKKVEGGEGEGEGDDTTTTLQMQRQGSNASSVGSSGGVDDNSVSVSDKEGCSDMWHRLVKHRSVNNRQK
jgi:hypothetical protein